MSFRTPSRENFSECCPESLIPVAKYLSALLFSLASCSERLYLNTFEIISEDYYLIFHAAYICSFPQKRRTLSRSMTVFMKSPPSVVFFCVHDKIFSRYLFKKTFQNVCTFSEITFRGTQMGILLNQHPFAVSGSLKLPGNGFNVNSSIAATEFTET